MEQVTSTRTALLQRRAQLELAAQGRDLLMEKRDQLMQEFQRVAGVALRGSDELTGAATAARQALDFADALDGPEEVAAAAFVTGRELKLGIRALTLMGVRIADISYPPVGRTAINRGYSLIATSPRIDRAAEHFEAEMETAPGDRFSRAGMVPARRIRGCRAHPHRSRPDRPVSPCHVRRKLAHQRKLRLTSNRENGGAPWPLPGTVALLAQ